MQLSPTAHLEAHKHSSLHRREILDSARCGCFYCIAIYGPAEIVEWVDGPPGQDHADINDVGQTAICPKCGIDSVIGDKSGYPLDEGFLSRMHAYWFNT
jgi:hypothetical protein